jgi:ABC-type glucose/galactose transport system permease subunit
VSIECDRQRIRKLLLRFSVCVENELFWVFERFFIIILLLDKVLLAVCRLRKVKRKNSIKKLVPCAGGVGGIVIVRFV